MLRYCPGCRKKVQVWAIKDADGQIHLRCAHCRRKLSL